MSLQLDRSAELQKEAAQTYLSCDSQVAGRVNDSNSFHRMSAKVPKKCMIKQLPPKDRFSAK
jgi:hypothetical protein